MAERLIHVLENVEAVEQHGRVLVRHEVAAESVHRHPARARTLLTGSHTSLAPFHVTRHVWPGGLMLTLKHQQEVTRKNPSTDIRSAPPPHDQLVSYRHSSQSTRSRIYLSIGCPSVRLSYRSTAATCQLRPAGLLLSAVRAGNIDRQRRPLSCNGP